MICGKRLRPLIWPGLNKFNDFVTLHLYNLLGNVVSRVTKSQNQLVEVGGVALTSNLNIALTPLLGRLCYTFGV